MLEANANLEGGDERIQVMTVQKTVGNGNCAVFPQTFQGRIAIGRDAQSVVTEVGFRFLREDWINDPFRKSQFEVSRGRPLLVRRDRLFHHRPDELCSWGYLVERAATRRPWLLIEPVESSADRYFRRDQTELEIVSAENSLVLIAKVLPKEIHRPRCDGVAD